MVMNLYTHMLTVRNSKTVTDLCKVRFMEQLIYFSSAFCTLIMLWLGAHLFKVEGANAREISVSNSPVVNERHAKLLRSVDGHLTACHQQHSLPRRARHLDNCNARYTAKLYRPTYT